MRRQPDKQTSTAEEELCTVTFMGAQTGERAAHHPAPWAQRPLGCQLDQDQLQCHTSTSGELELDGLWKGRVITSASTRVGCLKSTVAGSEMLGAIILMR